MSWQMGKYIEESIQVTWRATYTHYTAVSTHTHGGSNFSFLGMQYGFYQSYCTAVRINILYTRKNRGSLNHQSEKN